jgi:hypothetical protein
MAKIRVRTTAMDIDRMTMHNSKITDTDNSLFIPLDSQLLKLLPCVD